MTTTRWWWAPVLALASTGVEAGSFDESHPDQYFRMRAAVAVEQGRMPAAVDDFRRAARYADKPSQLALALAYWNGEGVPADRIQAYVWADLAAERGIPAFVAVRERMWAQLDETERAQAVAKGREFADEYQDAAAKPRLERLLRRGSRLKTGSRTGSNVHSTGVAGMDPAARAAISADVYSSILANVGPTGAEAGIDDRRDATIAASDSVAFPHVDIQSVVGGNYGANMVRQLGGAFMAASRYNGMGYYDPANWDPAIYWKTRDAPWRDLPVGAVTVGPLKRTR